MTGSELDAAVVGAAITRVGVWPERTSASLAGEALREALDDAGIDRSAIDGFVWNLGSPSGEDYEATMSALGLRARFVTQFWTHGRFTGSTILVAAMAVTHGLADCVVCVGGTKRRTPVGPASAPLGYGGSAYGDLRRYGMTSFVHEAALALQSYLAIHGADRDRLGEVVLAARDFAMRNPKAFLRDVVGWDEYLSSEFVAEPLRALDCFPLGSTGGPMNEYGACVIVTGGDFARGLSRPPVYIRAGQGVQAGREETYFGRPGLGLFGQTTKQFSPTNWDLRVFDRAGIRPRDVDMFFTYDAFSSLVWMALERFGHCPAGSAPEWVTRARIGPGGELPVNPNGGLLAEGHTAGWGHMVELTRQLRHEAGDRQVANARIAQWGTVFGDSVLFANHLDGGQP